MFTGLIEEVATVIANSSNHGANRLIIQSLCKNLQIGESIAINGVCLTLVTTTQGQLVFDVSPETLSLTTLGQLQTGQGVNLERAMTAHGRFGGHYVSGHVDTTAVVKTITTLGEYTELVVSGFAPAASAYLLPKGSITLDGVSLTINMVTTTQMKPVDIKLLIVPHTLAHTTFGQLTIGSRFNVEFDYLTRIVAHQVAHQLTMLGSLKSEV